MNGAPIHVLLIEDQPTDAVLLQDTLTTTAPGRFIVTHVERLADAVRLLGQNRYDVILSDLGLPDSEGPATFEQLRQHSVHLPIIVLSGLDDEEMAIRTVHAGAQDYLVKGRVHGDSLVRALRYAIERKRIDDELRRHNEQMAEDLAMAREFQHAFLPRRFPTFQRGAPAGDSALRFYQTYKPSGSVGGDFYTVFAISETRAGIFLCDVMGHGVRAALVTAMIRGLVEELKPLANEPHLFLAELNRLLVEVLRQTDTTMFVTAFYVMADTARHEITWATAGDPAPLLINRNANTVASLDHHQVSPGPVLGLFEASVYPSATTKVNPGDLLLLFTDGLYEVPNEAGEEFNLDRFTAGVQRFASLPPQKLLDNLVAEIQRFAAPNDFTDDVCLLGVEFAS